MTEGLGLLVQRNTWIPACAGMTEKGRNDTRTFIYKGFRPPWGQALLFVLH
jgi:hypothetical protein